MSRYAGGRFDGDRRSSRSPRDRSPYGDRGDRGDRGPQYPDADRRRGPPDSRGNQSGFPPGRDGFRDSLSGIQPPRGPKALLDPPSGPRGGGFAGDFRGGRGRGGGRGRQWRDDSREGGRDRDDYRDRPHFRDERSRERERALDRDRERERERDWPRDPRDPRDRVDFPRARRPSPPPLRARSPLPGRDFRDARDPPLGVDAERARRGSRDGPLSAGSSNSDPMFAPSPFRGGFGRGGGRGMGRGRGDWDQRGGRDRANFYDDRDRYPRSRSQESRWGREQDDRDRRYPDTARDLRDDREIRDRENRERDLIRPKPDRVSHEPPSAKDVSPPPLAPSAPAFGSVPSRQSTTTEIQSLTGKAPPTGPRALTEERPVSAGHGVGSERLPPTGPSKPALPDGGPPIPLGPRAQQKQQRSSKQWINPSLTVKKAQAQESPKTARSQNFPPQQVRPGGGYPSHSDYHRDFEKRPRSPGARSDSHAAAADRFGLHVATGANEIIIKSERGSQSARTSVDRETRAAPNSADVLMGGMDTNRPPQEHETRPSEQSASPVVSKASDIPMEKPAEEVKVPAPVERKPTILAVPPSRVQLPAREASAPVSDESSESDDDEDMDVYFEREISKTEAELQKLKDAVDKVPIRIVKRYATAVHEALLSVVNDKVNLMDMVGPIPEGFTFPRPKPGTEVTSKEVQDAEAQRQRETEEATRTREPSAIPTVEADDGAIHPPEPQPKVEEMDTEGSGLPPVPSVEEAKLLDEDVAMRHGLEPQTVAPTPRRSVSVNGQLATAERAAFFPHPFEQPETERGSASPDEESEGRTEDDASIYGSVEIVREFSATPPTEDLPVYNVKPWFQSRRVRKLADESPEFGEFFFGRVQHQTTATQLAQEELRRQYSKDYESYIRFTMSDDPAAIKSREYFTASGVQPGPSGKSTNADSKPEGGRRAAGRFSTELDLEAAIKESIREHQERKEREERAQKEKYRSDKEAVIPDMFWTAEEKERASFYDTAGLLPLEKLVATWQVVPRHINFTQEEADKFERAYLESPKQWGKISKDVGGRDPGTCILYYYAKKRELNLKDKLKKQPRRRKKGRGKQRSSALVSELGNTENETEDTAAQDTGENGERRRPPRRAAAPVWGNEATPNADSDGATPAPTPGRRRAGTTADARNEAGAEKPEGSKRGGRKPRQPKADKEAKGPKQLLAQAPGSVPLVAAAKTGRSRANSKAQGPEWLSPQTPVDLAARVPLPFEAPPGGMQPPVHPAQQMPLTSPDRAAPPMTSTMSEVMAPPSLRPEPPPPPATVPTFEIAQPAGLERIRTPQQASSYWSVSETTDFPGLLRAFGTDWVKIAHHMQTKTATMVKNYYVRQTKEGGKPEWEQIATEADVKGQRGEKRPAPPTPTQGPRKRYDVSSTGHRPLAAAEPEEALLTKVEPQQNQPFSRFQVPIAQAAPVSHPLVQPAPLVSAAAAQVAPPSAPAVTQTMSPHTHPLRPPGPGYPYPEREAEPPAQPQQPVRISQKPVPTAALNPMVSEAAPAPPAWATDHGQQFSLLTKEARAARDSRERQRLDFSQRESPRPVERAPLRMKQEPEQTLHHPEAYPQFQQPQRVIPSRVEAAPVARQPEPPRTTAPIPQSYAAPVHAQPVRPLFSEPPRQPSQVAPANERVMPGMQRQTPVSMQEQYGAVPVSAAPAPVVSQLPPPQQPPAPAPAPARAPERKVNIMSLLNDDPPPPKRVAEVPPVKGRSTPQPMVRQPPPAPPSATPLSRREVDTGYPYARNPAQAPQSAIPPLKPYHTQSPQPGHMRVPSTGMASSMDPAAEAQRDYYARHSYPTQHSVSSSNSPQTQQAHYPQHGQHIHQHPQQSQMGYQGQQSYPAYQVSQPHVASPTPQYAPHPSLSGRRDAPPTVREGWPPPQAMHHQLQLQQQQQQQQQQHPQHQQHPSQSGWPPSHQAPPKTSQPVPAQSAWGAQHGGVQTKPPVSSPLPPQQQQQHHTWPTSSSSQQQQQQQQPHPLNLRGESRGYESQSPTAAGMPHHPHHQHHNSLGGGGGPGSGRYAPSPQDAGPRRGEQQQPPPPSAAAQPPYARYSNTPGPSSAQQQQARGGDPGVGVGVGVGVGMPGPGKVVRSYTPVTGGFDPRGPPPPPPSQQQQGQQERQDRQGGQQGYVTQAQQEAHMREAQRMREQQHHMREMQGQQPGQGQGGQRGDMAGVMRGEQQQQGGGGGAGGLLGRQLRPGPEGPAPGGPGGPGGGGYERDGRRY